MHPSTYILSRRRPPSPHDLVGPCNVILPSCSLAPILPGRIALAPNHITGTTRSAQGVGVNYLGLYPGHYGRCDFLATGHVSSCALFTHYVPMTSNLNQVDHWCLTQV